ncbi:MAG: hypothetical protein GWN14_17415 [candidate division Zixibacteria bacterium]|nr:hypothetical protein [candidate division Zixibacteria bacterium]
MTDAERLALIKELLDEAYSSIDMSYDTQVVNQAHRVAAGGNPPRATKSARRLAAFNWRAK